MSTSRRHDTKVIQRSPEVKVKVIKLLSENPIVSYLKSKVLMSTFEQCIVKVNQRSFKVKVKAIAYTTENKGK